MIAWKHTHSEFKKNETDQNRKRSAVLVLTLMSIRDTARTALKINNPPTPISRSDLRPALSMINAEIKVMRTLTPPVAMVAYSAFWALRLADLKISVE